MPVVVRLPRQESASSSLTRTHLPLARRGSDRDVASDSRACCRGDSVLVLVVAVNPSDAVLVAAFRRTIEELVGAVEDVEAAGVGGGRIVDERLVQGGCP